MKYPSSNPIERVAQCLGDDLSRLHHLGALVADHLIKDSGRVVKRVRYGLRNGAATLSQVERRVASDFRVHPLRYIVVAAGLAAFLLLRKASKRQD